MGNVTQTADRGHEAEAVAGSTEHMRNAGPGWYFDPADEAIYRFWDGERWTDRLSDTVTVEIPRP